MRHLFACFALILTLPVQAQLISVGEGTARWGFFKLYDATLRVAPGLYARRGMVASDLLTDTQPTQLELCYHRSLTVQNFVDGANHALPNNLTPELRRAVDALHQAYRPVKAGDCYVLDYQPQIGTSLLLNGEPLVQINTPGFKAVYFGIWLGDNPLSDSLKMALLGGL